MEVDLGDSGENEIQEAGPIESADLGVKVELLDDVSSLGVERGDPGAQVAGDLIWVGEDALERQRASVVDVDAGDRLEDGAHVLELAAQLLEPGEDLRLGRLEDAVEPAEHDERQD